MPNEREVKLGMVRTASVDGRQGGLGVDNLPVPLVHRLRTLRLHLQVCKEDCDWATAFDEAFTRRWPHPEIRDVRRKLETAEAMVGELLGEAR